MGFIFGKRKAVNKQKSKGMYSFTTLVNENKLLTNSF